jgi:hypothetical protein
VGYITQLLVIKGTGPFTITLKLSCNIDYFDNQRINIGIQSGLKNSPIGGYLGISLPYFMTAGTLWTRAEYQSGRDAFFFRMEAGCDHIVSECDFRLDIKTGYTKLSEGTTVGAILYTAGGTAHLYRLIPALRYFNIYAGAGQMQFSGQNPSSWKKYIGPSFGLGTEVFNKNPFLINGQALFIRHHPEYQVLVQKRVWKLRFFGRYYQLNAFKEITIGAGWSIHYRLKAAGHN